MPNISVVIPVFNAEATLSPLCRELISILGGLGGKYEILFVEDCGADNSWKIVKELTDAHDNVRGIKLNRNYGQHNALLCGIRDARYEIVVTMDDDLQNPPSEVPRLLAKLEQGFDVVYGTPEQERHGLFRDLASQLTKLVLQNSMGVETARHVSAFRAFRTRLRDGFADYRSPFVSIDVLLTWTTTRFTLLKVQHLPRKLGTSGYTLGKLITHAFNMFTGFSTLPLQIASVLGFVFTLFGMAILAWVVARYFVSGSSVPGFPFLASIIAIFSGVQLFALGIFGEYLARIHFRTLNRPPYVIRETLE